MDYEALSSEEKQMCLMLYYDIWQKPGLFNSLEEGLLAIVSNKNLVTMLSKTILLLGLFAQTQLTFLAWTKN